MIPQAKEKCVFALLKTILQSISAFYTFIFILKIAITRISFAGTHFKNKSEVCNKIYLVYRI
jgi:hypothetical protein